MSASPLVRYEGNASIPIEIGDLHPFDHDPVALYWAGQAAARIFEPARRIATAQFVPIAVELLAPAPTFLLKSTEGLLFVEEEIDSAEIEGKCSYLADEIALLHSVGCNVHAWRCGYRMHTEPSGIPMALTTIGPLVLQFQRKASAWDDGEMGQAL